MTIIYATCSIRNEYYAFPPKNRERTSGAEVPFAIYNLFTAFNFFISPFHSQSCFDPASAYYFYLFIDTRFEEAVITRNIQERSRFFRSVGPEYTSISEYLSDFRCEVLTGEECIKLSAIK